MVVSKWIAGVGLALVTATAATAATPAFPWYAAGDWAGVIQANDTRQHLFIHIHKALDGGYVATLDSPERDAGAVRVMPIAANDGVLAFAVGGSQFRGEWKILSGRWEGVWTEAGASWPLTLSFNDSGTTQRLQDGVILELPSAPRSDPAEIAPSSAR